MQESVDASDFCSILEEAKARQTGNLQNSGEHKSDSSSVWRTICREAEKDAKAEPLLSSFLYASILSHDSFERSLAFVLSNRLSDATLLPTELFEVFYTVLRGNRHIAESAMADLCAVRERVRFSLLKSLNKLNKNRKKPTPSALFSYFMNRSSIKTNKRPLFFLLPNTGSCMRELFSSSPLLQRLSRHPSAAHCPFTLARWSESYVPRFTEPSL